MNKSYCKDYEIIKANINKIKDEKEKMEKIIEGQKIKIEDYHKHINILRKFIFDDDKTYNSINENSITNNGEILYNNINIGNKKFIEENKDDNGGKEKSNHIINGNNIEENIKKIIYMKMKIKK